MPFNASPATRAPTDSAFHSAFVFDYFAYFHNLIVKIKSIKTPKLIYV